MRNFTKIQSEVAILQSDLRVQQAGEVSVQALIPGDQLVGEGEAMHQPTLLQPEDGAETETQMHYFREEPIAVLQKSDRQQSAPCDWSGGKCHATVC